MTPIKSHRNAPFDLRCKSADRFPHGLDRCHENVSVIVFNQGH